VTIRPKYACRRCDAGISQAETPHWLIEGGLPTEGTLAHVAPLGDASIACRVTDETRAPVLDPGAGKTRTGYLWALARDGEPLWRHWFEPGGERLEWQ